MPRICEFFGIVIYMYFNDHNPAHFHAEYAESEASFTIDTLEVLEGNYRAAREPLSSNGLRSTGRRYERIGSVLDRAFRSTSSNPWND